MLKLVHVVSAVLRWATGLSFAILMVAVLVQVVTRTFSSGGSPVWTEEVTRYALLYVAGFGAGASLWTGAMVNVDRSLAVAVASAVGVGSAVFRGHPD